MKRRTVISMEQALAMPYATLRFVQLGWRVIRIEATPSGRGNPGDPNRYIGARVVDDDRHSYYVAPNVGKEAITLNLKEAEGQSVLQRLVKELDADVFTCNTVPSRYEQLGIDYETLCRAKPDLIWAGISAMGPEYPNVPGYDPAIQAMAGFMELTGEVKGPPMVAGVPIIDLKAGDEVYANVLLALMEKAETGKGRRIDVSMLQAASSWLITTLPLIDFDCEPSEITRSGNQHRKFVPTNAYLTSDGFIYVAMGSDVQWQRFTAIPKFAGLVSDKRVTNNGRIEGRVALFKDIAEIMKNFPTAEIAADLAAATIPNSPINTIPQVLETPAVGGRATTTTTPEGKTIRMQPMAVDLEGASTEFRFSPKYGEQTDAILEEAGYSEDERGALREAGIAV